MAGTIAQSIEFWRPFVEVWWAVPVTVVSAAIISASRC